MIDPATVQADPLGLLVAFGAGMLSFLSPCVLPLVPGYLSMVSGLSAAELGSLSSGLRTPSTKDPRHQLVGVGPAVGSGSEPVVDGSRAPTVSGLGAARSRLVTGMLAFIAGFTVVFTVLGASASALGRLFVTHQQALTTVSGIIIVVFGSVLVAMAAGLGLPSTLAGEHRFVVRPSLLGAWAPPIMGMAFAFAWTPCIGPVLGSVLTLAAGTGGSATGGIALLVAYSLGIGVPFFLSGLAFSRMTTLVSRIRNSLRIIDLAGGAVLIAFGLLLVTGHVSVVSDVVAGWLRDLHLGRLATS